MSEQLGAYVLDKRIGAGGMADVFLARGPGGVCVIKRPHSHLCANADFVRMFLDEASLLAQLNHPSIARIFDLGQQNGVYYLAMEYVPGFDLMTVSLEHERQGEYMAPELAAKVVADAAGALHYAHDAVGADGKPLHLIHRDVSPHNILVSTRGEVKLIDFGVARAAKTMHRTQAGLVKGKYPYMSPEQITGQTIDRRVDVYALGRVLYELLTNARAIAGDLEVQQIENARHGRIKPVEQLRPNVPATLRKILSGALHPQPEGRYQTAAALQADLEAYIVSDRHVVGREDLVRLFRVVAAEASHLPPEFDSSPAPAAGLGDSSETMRSGSYKGASAVPGPESSSETMRSGAFVNPSPVLPIPPDDDSHHPTDQVPLTEHGAELIGGLLAPTALATPMPAGVQVGGAAMPAPIQLTAEVAPSSPPRATELEAIPRPITFQAVSRNAVPAAKRNSPLLIPALGVLLAAGATAGYFYWPRTTTPVELVPPPAVVNPPPELPVVEPKIEAKVDPLPEAPVDPKVGLPSDPNAPVDPVVAAPPVPVKVAVVHVTATPAMEVLVDEKSWGVTPIDVEVLGGKHSFTLRQLDLGLKRTSTLVLTPGEKKELGWVPKKGKILVHVEPFGTVAIDGKVIRSGTSIADAEVWEGKHQVIVSNDELKKKITRTADVKAAGTSEVTVNLVADEK